MQSLLSKLLIALAFSLLAADSRSGWPDRVPSPAGVAAVRYSPAGGEARDGPVRITGIWRVEAADGRFAGLSALVAVPGRRLQALTDSGVLVDLPRPGEGNTARLSDLPAGPGYPTFKRYRDSEAMLLDRNGGGRWVSFENRHGLWRFEADGRGREVMSLRGRGWTANGGIEAMVEDPADGALLLIPEDRRVVVRMKNGVGEVPLGGATGGIADAVRLPDGRMVVAVREIGLLGIRNRLAWLRRGGLGYRLTPFATLPLGPLDNVEGLAADPGSLGGTRIWAVTDNDGWRRTLLLRMELDTTKAPAKAGAQGR
ncbi:esterase-like activity of phytase family protein [Sphingomonas swuensis]|uniref:esterase-like activity of phytase family protein n=1 Tax=Sphingomonas swuensis TaxID=977800 RepID=UPI0031CF5AD6